MESRLVQAVRDLMQAHAEARRADALGVERSVLKAQDGLDRVLQEIEAGAYVPTREEARAAIELAADAASLGWQATELRRLFRSAHRAV